MTWSMMVRRLRALFRRSAVEREMADELDLHLELQARALERGGASPDKARRRARAGFAGVESVKEAYRDARGVRPLEDLVRDVAYAVRSLRRRRAFALVTMLTIALGIGAATSIYTIVDGVLLRPLPFRQPDRLVQVYRTFPSWEKEPIFAPFWDRISLSVPEYRDLRDHAPAFSAVAIWNRQRATLVEANSDRAERVLTMLATPGMLDVLGVHVFRGRYFLPSDDVPGAAGVAVVSYEAWRSRFGGTDDIIGSSVRLDDKSYTIVGVLPPGLTMGRQEADPLGPPQLWIPLGPASGSDYNQRTNDGYESVARLATGVSIAVAQAQAASAMGVRGDSARAGTKVYGWAWDQTHEARNPLLLLLAGAALLLVIACVNVATVVLGESVTRQRELAARRALGGSRWRLARQLLTESLVLSAAGGALGLVVAWGGTHILVGIAPHSIPGLGGVRIDLRVIGAALLAVVTTGIAFGAVPALVSTRVEPAAVLRADAGQSGRGHGALQRMLVAGEFALSLVMLASAGLVVQSFRNVSAVEPGFRAAGLTYVNTILPKAVREDSALVRRIYDDAAARVAAIPGVDGAVLATDPPFSGGVRSSWFAIEGEAGAGASAGGSAGLATVRHRVEERDVGVGFFHLMGMSIESGRRFTAEDRAGSPPVAIISEASARRDFPGGSPLGRRIRFLDVTRTIVGVVSDVRSSTLRIDPQPSIYAPIPQERVWAPQIVMHAPGRAPTRAELQAALERADPRLLITDVHPMSRLMADTLATDRYRAALMTLFAVLAALLSAVGMYGVTSRAVARRRREVGIRLALGAPVPSVVRALLRATLAGAAAGVAVGLPATLATTRLLSPFLFGVSPHDLTTFVATVAGLLVVAAVAGWLPARRAGRLDVTTVLRTE